MMIIFGLCICQAPGIWHVVGTDGKRGATTEPEKATHEQGMVHGIATF